MTKRVYPNLGKVFLDGGLNNKYEKTIILDNESPDCKNVVFSNGAVGTREGISKLNTTAIGSYVCDGIYTRRAADGNETMIVWANGTAWNLLTSTFTTIGSAQSVFTAGIRVGSTQYENQIFFGNGGSIPYKWNGTDFTRHGVYPPTTTMTVASNAVGALTGDYRYKLTYVNSQLVESDVGPVTATFTAAGAQLRVSNIPTAPQSFGISTRRLYRTAAGGSTFKRVTTIADNTTTQYDDSTADGSLGVDAPTDNGVPPKYQYIVYHQNRLFCNDPSNPNYLWYSELNEPYTFKTTNFFLAGDATSDLITGIAEYNNSIVIYCEKSIFLLYMPDANPSNWQTIRVKTQYGSKSPFGFFNYNNSQMFPATQSDKFVGFAALLGDSTQQSATFLTVATAGSETQSEPIEPDIFDIQEGYLQNISAFVYKNLAYITVTYGVGQTLNNRLYVFDFSTSRLSKKQKASWVPWTGTKLSFAQMTVYEGDLYAASSKADGFVYQLNNGTYSDDGSAIDSYFWTKEFTGYDEDTNNHKDFKDANILVDQAGAYFMDLTYKTDSDIGDGNTIQVSITPGGGLWGSMVWGSGTWGGGNAQSKKKINLGTASGNRIQFKFSNQNTVNQRFKVHWLNFEYNRKGGSR